MNFKVSQLKSLGAGEVAVDDLIYVIDSNPTDGSVKSKKVSVGDLIDSRIYGISSSQFVLITGYYADPSWILSLDWSKIINAPSFVTSLSALTDVQLSTPLSGQALVYNGTKWINQGIGELDTLNSVTTRGNTTTNSITVGSTFVVGDWTTRATNVYVRAATGGADERGYYIGVGSANNGNGGSLTYNPTTNLLSLRSPYNSGTISLSLEGNTNSVQFHNTSGTVVSKFVSSTGNLLIGTTTDSGFKLDVNGTGRISSSLQFGTSNTSYISSPATGVLSLNSNIGSGCAVDINGQYKFYYGQLQGGGSAYFTTYLSVGTTSNLGATLNIKGAGSTSATTSLLVQNSSSTPSLTVLDNGLVSAGTSNTGVIMKNNGGYPSLAFWESVARWTIQREGSDVLNFVPNTTHAHGVISFVPGVYTGGVAIGSDTYQHASQLKPASAILSLYAESQGFLQPRLSTSQKNSIVTPATGLQLYDTTNNKNLLYNGTLWQNIATETWVSSAGFTTGSGTTNYLPKFTSATTLGNSNFVDDGVSPTIWVNSQNSGSRFYFSPVHSDGRINLNAVAGTNNYTLLRAWHTGNSIGLGTGSSAGGGALTTYSDSVLIGTSGAIYFMAGTFGPTNVPYRLGITTNATVTGFHTGVVNNLTNIESHAFEFTAKSHTFFTGTTAAGQTYPNQFTPLHLSTTGNVIVGGTVDAGYKLNVNGNTRVVGTSQVYSASTTEAIDLEVYRDFSSIAARKTATFRITTKNGTGNHGNQQIDFRHEGINSSPTAITSARIFNQHIDGGTGNSNFFIQTLSGGALTNRISIGTNGDITLSDNSDSVVYLGNTYTYGSRTGKVLTVAGQNNTGFRGDHLILRGGSPEGSNNLTGGNLILQGGYSRGTAGSNIIFQVPTPGTSGNTLNTTYQTALYINSSANIGIGTTSPNNTAKVDITSTTQGFLKPRLTSVEKNAITTPATGLEVYDSTTNTPNYYNGTTWVGVASNQSTGLSPGLFAQTSDSTPVANTTVETTLISTGVGTLSVPANQFQVGASYIAYLSGVISSQNNATLEIHLRSNGSILADTNPMTLAATTAKFWEMSVNFTVRAIGAGGVAAIVTSGRFSYNKDSGNIPESVGYGNVNSTTFDTTINNSLVITAQWGNASPLNSIQTRVFNLYRVY